jgi:Ca2+-binding EF-hand superfamily protein
MNSGPDLRDRNIGAVFDILDADGDGVLAAGDFAAMGERVCAQLGAAGTPQGTQILDLWNSWWEQLRADCDTDGDGRISRAEFAAAISSGHGDPETYYQQQLGRLLQAEAAALDADGDGFIEQAEYTGLLTAAGLAPDLALAGFQRLDTDGDARISTDEFMTGVAHIFLSQDPADPGTAILGHA